MKSDPKTTPEYEAFKTLLTRVLVVPHEEIVRREEEYRRQAALNSTRRGPKPKRKRDTSQR